MHKPFPGERLSALMETKFGVAIFWPLRKKGRAPHACRGTLTWRALLHWGWWKQGRQHRGSPRLELHMANSESKGLPAKRQGIIIQNIKLSDNRGWLPWFSFELVPVFYEKQVKMQGKPKLLTCNNCSF